MAKTMRERALALLCEIQYYEDRALDPGDNNRVGPEHPRARSVGLPYQAILDIIRAEFPGYRTTISDLRWFATKIRARESGYEGLNLCQRRPRPLEG